LAPTRPSFRLPSSLALQALDQGIKADPRFGILLAGRLGFDDTGRRPRTHPTGFGAARGQKSRPPPPPPPTPPLEFEGAAGRRTEIAELAVNQVVKVLSYTTTTTILSFARARSVQLLRLFDACRKTRQSS